VTVTSLGEQLTGVIPLGTMPSLGAVVEVEARGDLLVIPLWFEGPPPPAETVSADVTVTRARLVRGSTGGGSSDEFVDMGPSTTIDFYNLALGAGTTSHLYIVEIDGEAFPGETWFPDVPAGYDLVDVRPWITAYTLGPAQTPASGGTGYLPEPAQKPFLVMASTNTLAFDTSGTAYPGDLVVCGYADDLGLFRPGGGGSGADAVSMEPVDSVTTHIVVTSLGYRFTYSPTP